MVDFARISTVAHAREERGVLSRADALVGVLLILTMLVGGYFRFVGQNWDDYVHFHPDERFLTGVATSLGGPFSPARVAVGTLEERQAQYERCLARNPDTSGTGGFFDTECSTLNPHNANSGTGLYVYGTLPLFIARSAADLAVEITGDPTWVSYDGVHLVWRFLSAVSDMLVIAVVFLTGVQLHGKWVGLIAAMLYAGAAFPIQQAHFGTTDAMTTLFVTLAIWFAARVQRGGSWADYALFGVAAGAALASRINTAPVIGLLVLAAIVQALPVFDRHIAPGERQRVFTFHVGGLVIAALLTFVCFRVFNPYAFMGPGFFGLRPNPEWLTDIGEAQRLVSGAVEMPPNWQWIGRPSYIFPFTNMVLWGMGIALGLAGWASWAAAGVQLLRGRPGATRNVLPFVWVLVYFGWLGGSWVMTMRYYLPIYPALALLAAWGLVALVRGTRLGSLPRALATALLVGVVGFTLLWGLMFTNVYRHLFTNVQAGLWVWENAPGDFAMEIEGAPEGTPLVNIAFVNNLAVADMDLINQATRYSEGAVMVQDFVAPASGAIEEVFAPHLADPNDDPGDESIRLAIYERGGQEPLAAGTLTANFQRDVNVLGDAYEIELDEPLEVVEGQEYTFAIEVVAGGPVVSGGSIFAWEGDWEEGIPSKTCVLPPGVTLADDPAPGYATPATCNGRDAWFSLINGYKLQMIYDDVEVKRDRLQTILDNTDYIIIGTNRRYDTHNRIPSNWPMTNAYYDALFGGELGFELEAMFQETFELGPLSVSDQYLPIYDAPDWLNEFEAEEAFHVYDHPVVYIFRKTDAYSPQNTAEILGSVPLVGQGMVNFACPEAAEAGLNIVNYYCDPTLVGVYQLNTPGLDVSLSADQAPLALNFSDPMREVQYSGGTYADRFDASSLLNTQPVLAVVVWWAAMLLFGWAAWPLLFVAFPGLADRGYGFAKATGLILTGFLAWYVASARIPAWSQAGVLVALLVVAAVSFLLALRQRAAFATYLQAHWNRLFWIEVMTLVLFVAFLGVRLSNPDLWHPVYGGEKPMDFAYFNGVLRSTVFPPVDPWFAGGYINYYYFGYVIVGGPVLLLGILPSIAYNLIIPTLFALTGIGAFSVAFNLVNGWRERRPAPEPDDDREERRPRRPLGSPWLAGLAALLLTVVLGNLDTPRVLLNDLARLGGYEAPQSVEQYLINEYIAQNGREPDSAALLDIMSRAASSDGVLRISYELNVAQESVASVLRGIGEVLGGQPLRVSPDRWFWGPTRVLAEAPVNSGGAITEMPYFTFLYGDLHAHMIAMPLQLFVMVFLVNEIYLAERDRRSRLAAALAILLGGTVAGLLRATNTWDWVTFTVLGLAGLAFAWWLRWRGSARGAAGAQGAKSLVLIVSLGLLAMGAAVLFLAGSESRLPLLLIGAGAALLLWRVLWESVTRRSLIDLALRAGGFVVVGMLAALPYTTWYAATYNRVLPWEGNRTPLWAYVDIHGLFLFLLISLLLWDTGRWLRSTYVRSLRGKGLYLILGLGFLGLIVIGVLLLAASSYQVALIAIPLLVWIAVLFFRDGQSRAMQFVLALAGLAIALTLAVEFVVLDGDIGRQNTVFKFYIQVWLMFGVVGGAAFAWLWQSAVRWSGGLRAVWSLLLFALVFMAALYPFMATPGKAVFRMQPPPLADGTSPDLPLTLDGMDYMQYASQYEGEPSIVAAYGAAPFPLADDYKIIRWLQDNARGMPVIMEGRSEREYLWQSRISIYTGLPSVVGWNWHQRQQRTFNPLPRLVEQRVANVNAFYVTRDIETAWRILRHFDVEYVIVSGLERAYYPPESLAKFDRMVELGLLDVAFHEGGATIYEVNQDAELEQAEDRAGLDRS